MKLVFVILVTLLFGCSEKNHFENKIKDFEEIKLNVNSGNLDWVKKNYKQKIWFYAGFDGKDIPFTQQIELRKIRNNMYKEMLLLLNKTTNEDVKKTLIHAISNAPELVENSNIDHLDLVYVIGQYHNNEIFSTLKNNFSSLGFSEEEYKKEYSDKFSITAGTICDETIFGRNIKDGLSKHFPELSTSEVDSINSLSSGYGSCLCAIHGHFKIPDDYSIGYCEGQKFIECKKEGYCGRNR